MLNDDVAVGKTYTAKISGKLVRVRILSMFIQHNGRRAWTARNIDTGREIRIMSGAKLRREVSEGPVYPLQK